MRISDKFVQRKFLFFSFLIFFAFVIWSSVALQNLFVSYAEAISRIFFANKIAGAFIFVGLAVVSAMLSPFSSVFIVPVAIMAYGNISTALLLVLGWMIGDTLAYFIGSSAGYAAVKKFLPMEKAEYYKNKIPLRSQFWFIFAFRMILPAEITGYALGIIKYNFSKYLFASFLAELPFALIASYSGEAFINRQPAVFVALILAAIALIWITFYFFKKKLK